MKKILGAIVALALAAALLWWLGHPTHNFSAPAHDTSAATLPPQQATPFNPGQVVLPTAPPTPVATGKTPDPKAAADPRAELKTAIDEMVHRLEIGDVVGFIEFDLPPGSIANMKGNESLSDEQYLENVAADPNGDSYQAWLKALRLFQNAQPVRTETTPEGTEVQFETPITLDNGEPATAMGFFIKINGLWYLEY